MITRAIKNGFKAMKKRGWDKIYYLVDLHSTVIKPNYEAGNIPTEFYPHAKEVLQMISKRKDICLIMYTCSHPHEIVEYHKFFKEHNIIFEYVNENPEVKTQKDGYGCYDTKPYMNVLIDDKAGFDGETEWILIKNIFENIDLNQYLDNKIEEYSSGDEMKSINEVIRDVSLVQELVNIKNFIKNN